MTKPLFFGFKSNLIQISSKSAVIGDTDTLIISDIFAVDTVINSKFNSLYDFRIYNSSNQPLIDWTLISTFLAGTKSISINNEQTPLTTTAYEGRTFVRDKSYNISDTDFFYI